MAGIVTCVPGEGSVNDNPVIQCLDKLKQLEACSKDQNLDENLDFIEESFVKLAELCGEEGSDNVAIAIRNGALELICSLCSKIQIEHGGALASALKAMAALLHGMEFSI